MIEKIEIKVPSGEKVILNSNGFEPNVWNMLKKAFCGKTKILFKKAEEFSEIEPNEYEEEEYEEEENKELEDWELIDSFYVPNSDGHNRLWKNKKTNDLAFGWDFTPGERSGYTVYSTLPNDIIPFNNEQLLKKWEEEKEEANR